MVHLTDAIKTRFNRVWDNRICIGVTGLSQSGKSTFITSFINQLRNHGSKNARLGKLSIAINHRIHQVKIHPLEDRELPLFDYDKAIRGLSQNEPRWPDSTTDISGVLIEVVLKNGKTLIGKAAFKSIFIEIRDYPGEWLVDLPMRSMSFYQWSTFIGKQLQSEPRLKIDGNPFSALSAINPFQEYNPDVISKLQQQYCNFLRNCKSNSPSLSLLQPGRFIQPGKNTQSSMLDFVPLVGCTNFDQEAVSKSHQYTYYKILEQRYETYKSQLIESFFKEFISPVQRQVVLVDVLNVLNGGKSFVDDMVEALDMISESFKYKKGWFSSSIEQVHYIATKVDHVVVGDHDNITNLLGCIVKQSLEGIKDHRVKYKVDAVASVRSSVAEVDSKLGMEAIKAYDEIGKVIKYLPPRIPDHIPHGVEWDAFNGWRWPKLSPPKGIRASHDQTLPHIRMDYVLESLIGDLCD